MCTRGISECYTGVAFLCAHVFQYTLGHAQMEYPFMYASGLHSKLLSMYCATLQLPVSSCTKWEWSTEQVRMLHRHVICSKSHPRAKESVGPDCGYMIQTNEEEAVRGYRSHITIRIIPINYLIHPLNSPAPRTSLTPGIRGVNPKPLMRGIG